MLMNIPVFRYAAVLLLLLTFGCSLSRSSSLNTNTASPSKTNNYRYDTPSSDRATADEEIDGEAQNILDTALEYSETSQEFWAEGEIEKSIEALDQAYTLILQVNPGNSSKLIQQKDDLRFMISRRILEIYASRYTAVNGNHNAIPMTMNQHVLKEIKRFQTTERDFFIESYRRSGRYRSEMLTALRKAGLPRELSWLPLIESGFKVKAFSRARALGLWQFIPSTGYKFGLKRTTWIDERLDPTKSTDAAIAYLKELHHIFGDWATVLAAYNCGEGKVLRVIRSQKINYLDNFWDLYERLPRETARYYPRFLATLFILKDPVAYGFHLEELDGPLHYEVVTIEKPVHLKTVAEQLDVTYELLTAQNPELRRRATPPTPYALKVPPGARELLLANLDSIPKWTPPKRKYVYHRVRRGESLSLIAMKYRTSVGRIARANNIRRRHFIRAGQRLKIPLRSRGVRRTAAARGSYTLLPGGKYKVQRGDSLWVIAKKFHTDADTIRQINKLKTSQLEVGQVLQVKR